MTDYFLALSDGSSLIHVAMLGHVRLILVAFSVAWAFGVIALRFGFQSVTETTYHFLLGMAWGVLAAAVLLVVLVRVLP